MKRIIPIIVLMILCIGCIKGGGTGEKQVTDITCTADAGCDDHNPCTIDSCCPENKVCVYEQSSAPECVK